MRILVIIPAYNEEENIVRVAGELAENYPQFDCVVVDDGSTDRTAQLCRENGFRIIQLPVNLGLAGAVQAGMKYAWESGYDAAIQFDADGQHLPQYIQPLADRLAEGYDIVIGSRFVDEKKPVTLRMAGSRMITAAIRLTTGQTVKDPTSGMRIYSRRLIREMAMQINHAPEPDTVSYLILRGARVTEVAVRMEERTAGTSYFNIAKSAGYMMRMFVSILLMQWFRGGRRFDEEERHEL